MIPRPPALGAGVRRAWDAAGAAAAVAHGYGDGVEPPAVEDAERVVERAAQEAYYTRPRAMSWESAASSFRDDLRLAARAALSARPVEAQEVERLRAEVERQRAEVGRAWAAMTLPEGDVADALAERDAALARAEAAEAEARALRQGISDLAAEGEAWGLGVAVELARRLRALLDGEGRESAQPVESDGGAS